MFKWKFIIEDVEITEIKSNKTGSIQFYETKIYDVYGRKNMFGKWKFKYISKENDKVWKRLKNSCVKRADKIG